MKSSKSQIELIYILVRFVKLPISSGIWLISPLPYQFSWVTVDEEQVTRIIPPQHAVGLVGLTDVVLPINCQIRTTQQHWGEVESQVAIWASVSEIHADRANAKNVLLKGDEIIVLFLSLKEGGWFVYITLRSRLITAHHGSIDGKVRPISLVRP